MGLMLYILRELINEFRCAVLGLSDRINALCFRAIRKLDDMPAVQEVRRKDHGV